MDFSTTPQYSFGEDVEHVFKYVEKNWPNRFTRADLTYYMMSGYVFGYDAFGEDALYIQRFPYNHFKRRPYGVQNYIRVCDQQFVVAMGPPSLKTIDNARLWDLPGPTHRSERGWNVSTNHWAHFMQFPLEIRQRILGYFIQVPDLHVILPFTVFQNCVDKWRAPSYECTEVSYQDITHPVLLPSSDAATQTQSSEITDISLPITTPSPTATPIRKPLKVIYTRSPTHYDKYEPIVPKPVDAGVFRVCKNFCQSTITNFYRKGTFAFAPPREHVDDPSPTVLDVQRYPSRAHHPNPMLPSYLSKPKIMIIMNQLEFRDDLECLPGWVYYSTFLRWIHMIGPKNCAQVETLLFHGAVTIHTHTQSLPCIKCPTHSLVYELRLYIPFIIKFFPNLKSLNIIAEKDRDAMDDPVWRFLDRTWTTERALKPLLEEELREIPGLEFLRVVDENWVDIPWAKPSVEWFKERAKAKKEEILENARGEKLKEEKRLYEQCLL